MRHPKNRWLLPLTLTLWIGCDASQPGPSGPPPITDAPGPGTAQVTAPSAAALSKAPVEGEALAPITAANAPSSVVTSTSSSPLALARLGKRVVGLLADEDERRLRLLDLDTARELTSASLAGAPGHVVIDGAGRVYVAIRDAGHVASFDVACGRDEQGAECAPKLVERERIATPAEPIALGLSRDGATLLVACGWGRALVGHPVRDGEGRQFVASLAREPRGFALDSSGKLAIVAHALGSRVSIVAIDDGTVVRERALEWRDNVLSPFTSSVITNVPRHAVQGFAVAVAGERAHIPMVLAYPGDPQDISVGYGLSVDEIAPYYPHEPALVVVDVAAAVKGPAPSEPPAAANGPLAPRKVEGDVVLRMASDVVGADQSRVSAGRPPRPKGPPPCLLPRAAAVDSVRGTVLVACFDIGAVVELGPEVGPLAKTERRRFSPGKGPSAVVIEPDKREAWVWLQFDRRLSAIPLDKPSAAPRAAINLPAGAPSLEEAGRRASSREEAGRRAFHEPTAFDGRSCASCHIDGREDGLVWSSPVGQVQTPVLAGRSADTLPVGWRGESATMEAHVKRGFERLRGPKADDETVAALARYIAAMPTYRGAQRALTSEEARGREIFHSPETSCSTCHAGEGVWTDGIRRDVGTGAAFDTPSLRFLGDTAPYMHDGRYLTLRELLVASDGKMGFTRHLNEAEMSALIAFLKTL